MQVLRVSPDPESVGGRVFSDGRPGNIHMRRNWRERAYETANMGLTPRMGESMPRNSLHSRRIIISGEEGLDEGWLVGWLGAHPVGPSLVTVFLTTSRAPEY